MSEVETPVVPAEEHPAEEVLAPVDEEVAPEVEVAPAEVPAE